MFTTIKNHKWIILVCLLYILFLVVAGIGGNYPTNDDWYFVRQVKAFSMGIYSLHAKVLPIFLTQGLIGLIWGSLFGISFSALRLLTLLITLLSALFFYKTLLLVNKSKEIAAFGSVLFLFNPLVLSSAFTFMTENYYLLFIVLGTYFSIHYFTGQINRNYYLALLFISLASLTRQTGLFLFVSLVIPLLTNRELKFEPIKKVCYVLFLLITLLLIFLWPRYDTNVIDKSINLSDGAIEVLERFKVYLLVLPMIVFWVSPLIPVKKWVIREMVRGIIVSIIFGGILFKLDLFPLGSVFYIEGLHLKSGFRHSLSVFDNVPAKLAMSLILGYLFTNFLYYLKDCVKPVKKNNPKVQFISLSVLGILSSVLLTAAVYDRYFLPLLPFLLIVLSRSLEKLNKINYIILCGFLFINTILVYESVVVRNLKHQIFEQISNNTDIKATERDIYVDDTYSKYLYAEETKDYVGEGAGLPVGLTHTCYIQQYTRDSALTKTLEKLEEKIEKRIENPDIYGATPPIRDIRITKHLDDLIYNEMYFSPLYSIIGKTAYVGGWCDK